MRTPVALIALTGLGWGIAMMATMYDAGKGVGAAFILPSLAYNTLIAAVLIVLASKVRDKTP